MTEQTAKKMFNALYKALDYNGFKEEIATFIISQESNDLIADSEIAMNQLYYVAQNPSRAKRALYILTEAIRTYFDHAKRLPEMYREQLISLYRFTDQEPDFSLIIDGEFTNRRVDITTALNPPELKRLLEMVEIIKEDLEKPDDNGLFASLISI